MRKKTNILIFPLLLMSVFLVFASSCKKDDDNDPSSNNPSVGNNQDNGKTTALFNTNVTYGTMTDQDGNTYKTVTIGTQTWMAENLRTTKYNDGTGIRFVFDDYRWGTLTTGAYCNCLNSYNNETIATYGRLYNWYAVNTGKLSPKGWHVPTDAEWTTLIDYLGGADVAGGKLKETGTTHWNSPNIGATNETGFTALPGGARVNGAYNDVGYYGDWWSATESYIPGNAWLREVYYDYSIVYRLNYFTKQTGLSVRCVKD